ncbi:MAG: glycosyltransferase, partial [Caldisphaera sp.]
GLNDDILARLYSSSDIFLFTSRAEGFGLPPLEAMACGTAVISTDSKGTRDYMINGYNALVAKTKNPDEIADLLVQALDNKELVTISMQLPFLASSIPWASDSSSTFFSEERSSIFFHVPAPPWITNKGFSSLTQDMLNTHII